MKHDPRCITTHNVGKCPHPQNDKPTQDKQQIPAFKLTPEQAHSLNKSSRKLAAELGKTQGTMIAGIIRTFDELTANLKQAREAADG